MRVRTFCPLGRFVLGTFCPWDVLFLGRFVPETLRPRDVLSRGTFCLGTFCLCTLWATYVPGVEPRYDGLLPQLYAGWVGSPNTTPSQIIPNTTVTLETQEKYYVQTA